MMIPALYRGEIIISSDFVIRGFLREPRGLGGNPASVSYFLKFQKDHKNPKKDRKHHGHSAEQSRWIGFQRTHRANCSYVVKKYKPNKQTNKQTNDNQKNPLEKLRKFSGKINHENPVENARKNHENRKIRGTNHENPSSFLK
jgi:hypothetical protein